MGLQRSYFSHQGGYLGAHRGFWGLREALGAQAGPSRAWRVTGGFEEVILSLIEITWGLREVTRKLREVTWGFREVTWTLREVTWAPREVAWVLRKVT